MAALWRQRFAGAVEHLADDRPLLQCTADRVRLEILGRDAVWILELTRADAERVAEAIDWQEPGVVLLSAHRAGEPADD